MGILAKTLDNRSSHGAKKTTLWPDLMARVTDCVLPEQLDAFEQWRRDYPLEVPAAWHAPLAEIVEKRREEIAADDITTILRERFDF